MDTGMSLPQSDKVLAMMQMEGIKGNDIILGRVNEEKSHSHSQYRTQAHVTTDQLHRRSREVSVLTP